MLALDSDPMPGLAMSLGAEEPPEPPLNQAAENYEKFRWRLKGHRAGPRGAALLDRGAGRRPPPHPRKGRRDGLARIQGSVLAYHETVNRLHRAKTFASGS